MNREEFARERLKAWVEKDPFSRLHGVDETVNQVIRQCKISGSFDEDIFKRKILGVIKSGWTSKGDLKTLCDSLVKLGNDYKEWQYPGLIDLPKEARRILEVIRRKSRNGHYKIGDARQLSCIGQVIEESIIPNISEEEVVGGLRQTYVVTAQTYFRKPLNSLIQRDYNGFIEGFLSFSEVARKSTVIRQINLEEYLEDGLTETRNALELMVHQSAEIEEKEGERYKELFAQRNLVEHETKQNFEQVFAEEVALLERAERGNLLYEQAQKTAQHLHKSFVHGGIDPRAMISADYSILSGDLFIFKGGAPLLPLLQKIDGNLSRARKNIDSRWIPLHTFLHTATFMNYSGQEKDSKMEEVEKLERDYQSVILMKPFLATTSRL